MCRSVSLTILSALLLIAIGSAQQTSTLSVPTLIRYSGALKDPQGATLSSATSGVTFAIYKQQEGGAPVWMETQNVTSDPAGNYSVLLGSTTAAGLPGDLFSQQEERWLGVQVQGQAEQPRVLLVSVPYAFKAHEAETLGGKTISDFVLAPSANSSADGSAAESTATNPTQSIPSGTTPPAVNSGPTNFSGSTTDQIVKVTQSSTGAGITASANTNAIYGLATGSSGNVYGVQGVATGTGGVALFGNANNAVGGTYGIKGSSSSTSGTGMRGLASASSGNTIGVSSQVNSPNGTAAVFNNAAGGKILSGQNNAVEKFSIDGAGNVSSAGSFSGSGAGLTGIPFSQLAGQLSSSQFSGSYSNAVTLSSTANIFYGDGSHLSGVVAGSGSPYYIQNTTSQQANANFNISGNGTAAGTLTASAVNTGTAYEISGSNILTIGTPSDSNLFLGIGAGVSDVPGRGQHDVFLGPGAGLNNTNGILNTFVGYQAGYTNTTGNYNTFVGYQSGYNNTTGANNTFYGVNTGTSNVGGHDNTFSGESAGNTNAGGSDNTFIGSGAGFTSTNGSYNTFLGHQAGYSATNASYNTFLGEESGYTTTSGAQNTFTGFGVGYYNTTGSYNTYSGYYAGVSNTTGHDNTFTGWEAGYSNATGVGNAFYGEGAGNNSRASYNLFYGYYSGTHNSTGNNDIYVGNLGPDSGTESNAIRIGGDIGTGYGAQTAAYVAGIYQESVDAGTGVAVVVDANGKLGTMLSSRRFKDNIRDMGDSTNGLMKLRPVTFLYKPEYGNGDRTVQYGLIAEEVANVYPELVSYDKEGKPFTVRYQYLAAMLLNEVQKQYRRAEQQSEVVETQQQQLAAQAQEIESLKQQLQVQNATLQQRLSRIESLVQSQLQTVAQEQ